MDFSDFSPLLPIFKKGFSALITHNQSTSTPQVILMDRVQIKLEYVFKASPDVLYGFFTTPDRLIMWFCEEASIDKETYTFSWQGSEEEAVLIDDIEGERVRFSWTEEDENEFFEFSMTKSPVTGQTILFITDYCDADEVDDQTALWDMQLKDLKRAIGEA